MWHNCPQLVEPLLNSPPPPFLNIPVPRSFVGHALAYDWACIQNIFLAKAGRKARSLYIVHFALHLPVLHDGLNKQELIQSFSLFVLLLLLLELLPRNKI